MNPFINSAVVKLIDLIKSRKYLDQLMAPTASSTQGLVVCVLGLLVTGCPCHPNTWPWARQVPILSFQVPDRARIGETVAFSATVGALEKRSPYGLEVFVYSKSRIVSVRAIWQGITDAEMQDITSYSGTTVMSATTSFPSTGSYTFVASNSTTMEPASERVFDTNRIAPDTATAAIQVE